MTGAEAGGEAGAVRTFSAGIGRSPLAGDEVSSWNSLLGDGVSDVELVGVDGVVMIDLEGVAMWGVAIVGVAALG